MRLQHLNAAALVVILTLSAWGAGVRSSIHDNAPDVSSNTSTSSAPEQVRDARGQMVPTADYARIVSLNSVADPILLSLVEPHRIVAVSTFSGAPHPDSFRFTGLPGVARAADLERIVTLRPDLVVASKFSDEAFLTRLREAGIQVFDLGEMRGVGTTLLNIDVLGALLRQPDRAQRVLWNYTLSLSALDAAVPDDHELPGLYLSLYGDSLFGGTVGSSYADMLHYAGIDDLAEAHGYREWPKFSPEDLLVIDPPLVVTQAGMARLICEHTTLSTLACCGPDGRVVEVPSDYHSEPGLGLVYAARALQHHLHPHLPSAAPSRAPSVRHLAASEPRP